jgi:hypothetical protein
VYDEDLTNLDEGIRRLKIEYDIFLNGGRKKPPDDARLRVERMVKRLGEATDMSFPQRFRYNTLIARFYVYRDRWRRRQQERETASGFGGETARLKPDTHAQARPIAGSAVVQISISDPETEATKVRQLYDELLRMSRNRPKGSPEISFQQFSSYITSQAQNIKKKCRCSSVTFRLAIEEKAIKFTAKAGNESSG